MASLGRAIVTSTPNPGIKDSTALREMNWQNIQNNNEEENRLVEEKVKIRTDKFKSKENRRRNVYRGKQVARKEIDDLSSKRRIQAIEAMQIAELRRRRTSDEENLAQEMENLNINANEYLPDGRLKLSRPQIIARNQKRKRIEQYMREQNAKKQGTKVIKRTVSFNEPIAWKPRPKFSNKYSARPKMFQCPKKIAPVATTEANNEIQNQASTSARIITAEKQEQKQEVTTIDNQAAVATSAATTSAGAGEEEKEKKETTSTRIRYTADELRELNPYGYYFM